MVDGKTKCIDEEIGALFESRGGSLYGGEGVTQLEHALQAADLAERQGASSELIAAALLHDIGHLLHDLPDDAPDRGVDDAHEYLGAAWLAARFPPAVLEPVRMHVASKRYLCAAEPGYWDSLSEPSKVSLTLQGGPMSADECSAFRAGPHCRACLAVRRWDDLAKVAGLETPPLTHFLEHVRRAALGAPAPA
ncbi:hypothetical protein Pla175_29170 [Pirellulimonas nuda]|uniref:HD domain-containing protein n=1 Tax=Pirellulimonas nuda TaxID=2528009 RepID=A0A518DDG7_9BACT|nr:phosphonate degradation HD-domain oxygenase [Pirellulimonas nuda]QDU89525.1 hypothetical protein Pla175_29170 [Pirellulimonas nuda]